MMPFQSPGLVPTGVVQHQTDSLLRGGMFFGHRIQKGLKHLRVAVRHDQTDEPPGGGIDGADDVPSNVTSVVSLCGSAASLDPALSGSWIPFKPGFVTEEDVHLRVLQELQKLGNELFALLQPCVLVRRFGNRTGNAPRVIVFMKVTQKCSIIDLQITFLLEPATQAHDRPVVSIRTAWIIHHRQDLCGDVLGRKHSGPSRFGAIGDAINTGVIEAFDPELKATHGDARVSPSQIERSAAEEEMNRVQPFLRLPVRATITGQPQLIERAVIWIGKFAWTADATKLNEQQVCTI